MSPKTARSDLNYGISGLILFLLGGAIATGLKGEDGFGAGVGVGVVIALLGLGLIAFGAVKDRRT